MVKQDMEVAFVSFLYPNVDHTGGSTYTFNLCRALAKYVNVTAFVPNVGDPRKINPGISHVACNVLKVGMLRPATFAITAARKLRGTEFDVVHSHCGAGLFLRRISVETFHHRPTVVEQVPQLRCLRKARHIIAVSFRAKQELLEMGFSEDNVSVVSNGIDYEHFVPNPKARSILNEKADIAVDKPLILSVPADGKRRKNLPWVLKTVRYLVEHGQEPVLLVVGSPRLKARTMQLALRYGVLDKVRYFEDVSDDAMPLFFSACDFLAHPSVREGFGFVLLEAISSGRPFVAMDAGVAQELAGKGLGYVATSENEFMEICLKMTERPLRLWNRGHKFVKDNYSWDRCAKETVKVYEAIL